MIKWIGFVLLLAAVAAGTWWLLSSMDARKSASVREAAESAAVENANATGEDKSAPPKAAATAPAAGASKSLEELRAQILVPALRTMQDEEARNAQLEAIKTLANMRTQAAAEVLGELVMANPANFFSSRPARESGRKTSASYEVLTELRRVLKNAPPPQDGAEYGERDLTQWRLWWMQNKDRLEFLPAN